MFAILPDNHDLLVAHQADSLSKCDNLVYWYDQGALCLNHEISGVTAFGSSWPKQEKGVAVLRVFGPYLNLEKIVAVYQALGRRLALGAGRFLRRHYAPFGVCAEIAVNEYPSADVRASIEATAMALQVELVILESVPSLSQPGLLLMDMDSTVIAIECIDEIAKLAGCGEQVAHVTELAMQGKLAFSDSLRNRVACLQGAQASILAQVRNALPLMNGLQSLLEVLKTHHWKLAIASGGFTYFAGYLQQRLGLDYAIANELSIDNHLLTGTVNGNIVDAEVKADTLGRLASEWSIPANQTIALGDGANDLLMLGKAQLGVAYHAKPVVRQQAQAAIRFGGLDNLLWMLAD